MTAPPSSKATPDAGTPVLRQYLDAKSEFPDAVMLFRLGDFFETFQDDAEVASRVLGITLTSRDFGRSGRHPMAGFPAHSADAHVGKLLRAGHSVAICDQVEQAVAGKGLVRREVVRVLTPGTLLEGALLDPARENLLASLSLDGDVVGVALVEASAGRVELMEVPAGIDLVELLGRVGASEVLLPDQGGEPRPVFEPLRADSFGLAVAELESWRFEPGRGRRRALELTGTESLLGFDSDDLAPALGALGAAIDYLERSRVRLPPGLFRLRRRRAEAAMHLDQATIGNLELVQGLGGSGRGVLGMCDRTHTPMGARLLRARLLAPLVDPHQIAVRVQQVSELTLANQLRADLAAELARVRDLERLTTRAAQGRAAPRDLGAVRDSLPALPRLREVIGSSGSDSLAALAAGIADSPGLADLLEQALERSLPAQVSDGGLIRTGYDSQLDELRSSIRQAQDWIAGLEASERDSTGIRGLKVGFNRVFGYYLEVSNSNRVPIPERYHRKQTLAGGERYVTADLKEREAVVLNGEQAILSREREVFSDLCEAVGRAAPGLLSAAEAVGEIDAALSLATAAIEHRWSAPVVDAGPRLAILGGRHPLVEAALPSGTFVPNDTLLEPEARLVLLTGPNMAGKSTYLRQVGIIVLLAQVGGFVPAARAEIGVVDRIFTRVGAQDAIASGLSTFMVEMVETAQILHHATPRSLVLIDEIGRGTSTYDGMSIAQAVIERLHDDPGLGCRTIFATHFHELTALERRLVAMRNHRVEVSEDGGQVTFLHRIVPGGADRSYGINVAEIAGLPAAVTTRAREVLAELETARPLTAAAAEPPQAQLPLPLTVEHPLVAELRGLDVDSLSPLEALNRLAQMKSAHRADGAAGAPGKPGR